MKFAPGLPAQLQDMHTDSHGHDICTAGEGGGRLSGKKAQPLLHMDRVLKLHSTKVSA